jgi:hypothetical protein
MNQPRRIDRPEPGFWMMRLVKGGPEVPAAILRVQTTHEPGEPSNQMDRSPFLVALINGEPVDLATVWERRGRPVTRAEYEFQLADGDWHRAYAPDHPKANPTKPIDTLTVPLPF